MDPLQGNGRDNIYYFKDLGRHDGCLMGNINPNVFGDRSFADIENEVKKLYGCSSRKRLHPLDRMGDPASEPWRL